MRDLPASAGHVSPDEGIVFEFLTDHLAELQNGSLIRELVKGHDGLVATVKPRYKNPRYKNTLTKTSVFLAHFVVPKDHILV